MGVAMKIFGAGTVLRIKKVFQFEVYAMTGRSVFAAEFLFLFSVPSMSLDRNYNFVSQSENAKIAVAIHA